MEDWQVEHITKNLNKLIDLTTLNGPVKAELLTQNVLCKADVEQLDATQRLSGDIEASRLLYKMLLTRQGAYRVLSKALKEANQSGAYKILIKLPPELFSKLFQNAEIQVNGKTQKLHEFFPSTDYHGLQRVFEDCLTELEIYDTFITKHQTFVLATNSLPPKPPYYVSRFLSNRIQVPESTFKSNRSDVFVFKDTIPRYKLSQMASPNFTTDSTSQLTNITCRFIYLDDTEDWVELKKKAKVPIHLINCEEEGNIFILEDSSAPSDILRNLGSKEERVYLSEDDFVKQQLSEDSGASNICICDTPGMGKTLLLANIARCMIESSSNTLIVFIPLSKFSTEFEPTNSTPSHDTAILNVLKYISTSQQNNDLLLKSMQAQLLQVKIFFDGFDEVSSDKSELMKQVFLSICIKYPNVRMYITSRPHLRQELEKSLEVIAYDILPFNQQNQIDFLTHFWTKDVPVRQTLLQDYAASCLEAVNKSLTKNDKKITGIPLLCQLIGEVYEPKTGINSNKKRKFGDMQLKLSKMYPEFIKKRINLVARNDNEFKSIKLAHVWHALQLLFPTSGFKNHQKIDNIKDLLTSSEILRAGILQKHSNSAFEFLHRTFAEYLVAEYFFSNLQMQEILNRRENNLKSLQTLKLVLEFKEEEYGLSFVQPVIVSFFNSALGGVTTSEELNRNAVIFVKCTSHVNFISILRLCCQHKFLYIFSLFMECEWIKCEVSRYLHCFTYADGHDLLRNCIIDSSSQMFRRCIQTLTEVFQLDETQLNEFVPGETLLQQAVECTNYEVVEYFVNQVPFQGQRLLEKCVRDSYFDDKSRLAKRENILQLLLNKDSTLLHEIQHQLENRYVHLRFIILLVKSGANLNAMHKEGKNFVVAASSYLSPNDFQELVHFLLKDCKAKYLFLEHEKWKDPLPYIVQQISLLPQTLELLLTVPGVNINVNLLFLAVQGNKLNNVQQLVSLGLDYNARREGGSSLLHVGAWHGGPDMVEFLLSLKLDPNSFDKKNCTPLHYAVHNSFYSLDVVRVLVENGTNVQAKNLDGQSAFHLLIKHPDNETIKYLIEHGADVYCPDKNGNTPLHLCQRLWTVKLLIEMGADVHAKNNKLQTVLHVFAQRWSGELEIIKYYIEKGVKINSCDEDGNTPLHLCKTKDICEYLIEMGADIHAENNKSQTVLHVFANYLASEQRNRINLYQAEKLIEYLVEKGVKVNSCDEDGNTPLHLCKHQDTSQCLIKMGADVYATNKMGETPPWRFSH